MAIVAGIFMPHPTSIIPEVGGDAALKGIEEEMTELSHYIASKKPDTLVVISAHAEGYRDYFQVFDGEVGIGSLASFGAHEVNFRLLYDKEFVRLLSAEASSVNFPAGTTGDRGSFLDYGTMVPLYFVQKAYSNFRLVRIGVSSLSLLDHYRLGKLIRSVSEKLRRKVIVIASGELSHHLSREGYFGYSEDGAKYEETACKILKTGNFLQLLTQNRFVLANAGECGNRSLCIMAGALDAQRLKVSHFLHVEHDGIGYATALYEVLGADASRSFEQLYLSKEAYEVVSEIAHAHPFTQLARKAIQVYVSEKARIAIPEETEFLSPAKPVFVTLKLHGSLHGCIGAIKPAQKNLGAEIIENAISTAKDPRFPSLTRDDFPYLSVSVDILGALQRVHSIYKLDPKRYGLYLQCDKRHAFILPNQEGIETIEEQLEAAKRKAGVEYDDPLTLYRVPVTHYR